VGARYWISDNSAGFTVALQTFTAHALHFCQVKKGFPMKNITIQTTLFAGLMAVLASTAVQAQEVGKVISSTPIIQQVAVPRQVCNNQQVVTGGQKSGAGAAMGAIAGGVIGNQMGQGSGNAAATMLGLFGGAILGDKIEGPGTPEVKNVQNCSQQMFYENRTMAYNVVYEYAGKQYTVQMPQDPGPTVRLQITPMAPAPNNGGYGVPPAGSAPRY
jgi:uncharacterized protein YcfJ